MKISAAFPSKYLKAADLQDRNVSVVIERVEFEEVGDTERKPVLHFQARTKGLVLNKTSDDTDSWRGRSLVVVPRHGGFPGRFRRSHSRQGAAGPSGFAEAACTARSRKSGSRS